MVVKEHRTEKDFLAQMKTNKKTSKILGAQTIIHGELSK